MLKELEKDFNKGLEKDYLTRTREAKGSIKETSKISKPESPKKVELPPIGK